MTSDLVVESREWRGRVEIVSHINHTQIARVRSALGELMEPYESPFSQKAVFERLTELAPESREP